MQKVLAFFSLFTSVGTLVCCALPALLVVLGMGAALSGIIGAVPQIVWLSEHKQWIFGIGGFLLAIGGFLQWKSKDLSCPVPDSKLKTTEACESTRNWSRPAYFVSIAIYLIGGFFAFVAPLIG